jgi:hypothetical protein
MTAQARPKTAPELEGSLAESEAIRVIEGERLRALLQKDFDTAGQFHADDFQLITPFGDLWSKEQYFENLASGQTIEYVACEPGPIDVRFYGEAAVIRYLAHWQVRLVGKANDVSAWHTDSYEKRDGRWQVVWSQATPVHLSHMAEPVDQNA